MSQVIVTSTAAKTRITADVKTPKMAPFYQNGEMWKMSKSDWLSKTHPFSSRFRFGLVEIGPKSEMIIELLSPIPLGRHRGSDQAEVLQVAHVLLAQSRSTAGAVSPREIHSSVSTIDV